MLTTLSGQPRLRSNVHGIRGMGVKLMSTGDQGVVLILGDPADPHTLSVSQEPATLRRRVVVLDVWETWEWFTLVPNDGCALVMRSSETMEIRGPCLRLKPRLGGGYFVDSSERNRQRLCQTLTGFHYYALTLGG